LKLYLVAKNFVSTTFLVNFLDALLKSVKHTGLVSFDLWMYSFAFIYYEDCAVCISSQWQSIQDGRSPLSSVCRPVSSERTECIPHWGLGWYRSVLGRQSQAFIQVCVRKEFTNVLMNGCIAGCWHYTVHVVNWYFKSEVTLSVKAPDT